ncbi:MAG: zf-HC2 domain-containing protein [Candidatus Eisenbacteria bacterium]|nr:zf-HC2 domain-containing protein [Candidatus Eisenbacteria bacterium]
MTTRNSKADRTCGWTEEQLFLWFDDDLPRAERIRFESHLADCAVCARERVSYERLFSRLDSLGAPSVAHSFDDAILEGAFRPIPARFALDPGTGWLRGALLAAASIVVLVLGAMLLVDEQAVVQRAAQPVVHLGARATADAVIQLISAVNFSQVVIDLVRSLEPVVRSMVVVARAFQAEFLLVSLLLSLVALVGAIRLADGTSAVERGVRRVCLVLHV